MLVPPNGRRLAFPPGSTRPPYMPPEREAMDYLRLRARIRLARRVCLSRLRLAIKVSCLCGTHSAVAGSSATATALCEGYDGANGSRLTRNAARPLPTSASAPLEEPHAAMPAPADSSTACHLPSPATTTTTVAPASASHVVLLCFFCPQGARWVYAPVSVRSSAPICRRSMVKSGESDCRSM